MTNFERASRHAGYNGFLAEALLEVRELVPSGSKAMGIIDEALIKAGVPLFKERHPDCSGLGTVHTVDEECDHCRRCGGGETDPDGLCDLCLMCSLCCECGTFVDEDASGLTIKGPFFTNGY